MRLVAVAAVAWLVAAVFSGGVASAQSNEQVDDIAAELNTDGVYVQQGLLGTADGSETDLRRVVDRAQSRGLVLSIVSLSSEWNGQALAEELSRRVGGTVLVITPVEIAAWSPTASPAVVDSAIDVPSFNLSLTEGSASFVDALIASAGAGSSSSTSSQSPAEGSSGGGSGFLIVVLVIVAGIVGLIFFQRMKNRRKVNDEMGTRREEVGTELADLGAEIYEIADRVTVADNDEATTHFRDGNEQYLALQKDLEQASTLWEITKIDYAADTAAWHLDAAEAILDGEDIPEEPDRPDLRVSRPPAETAPAERLPPPPSRRVEPRQRRRTQWDPPRTRGGGLGDLVTGVLVGGILRGGGQSGGRRRAPRGWSGGGSLGGLGGGGSRSRSSGGGGASKPRGGGASKRR